MIGSSFAFGHNTYWYADVEHKVTGKKKTYYLGGAGCTREAVAEHLATYYRKVKPITIYTADEMPKTILATIETEDYEYGELSNEDRHWLKGFCDNESLKDRGISIKPISIKPIKIRPILSR